MRPGGAAMPVPVPVLRLPRGPEGSSRGFSPSSPRFQAFFGANSSENLRAQEIRAALRERFLRALAAARGRPTRFFLWGGVSVDGVFGAADVEAAALQVDALQTPLGVQEAALLRCSDIVSYSFLLD